MTEHVRHPLLRLGAEMSPDDDRTLRLARYIDPKALPPAPTHTNNAAAVASWPMFLNDQIGDCTIASFAHADELFRALGGVTGLPVSDDVVLAT